MAKLSTVPRNAIQSVLVYGPPKVGKTQLVSELAAEFNLIWFDLENGHATLFKLPEEQQERIELIALPDSRAYPIAIETCLKAVLGNPGWIDNETGKWVAEERLKRVEREYTFIHLNSLDRTWVVVFDSLTQLTSSAIAHITKNQPEDYKLQFDDYGRMGTSLDKFLSAIQQAKFNSVCISHETEVELEDGKVKIVPTAGTRNFSRTTAKYFGHVVYCQVSNKKHGFISSTTGTMNIITGSRTDIATERMGKASLIPIFKGEVGKPAAVAGKPAAQAAPVNQSNGQKALTSLQQKMLDMKAKAEADKAASTST